MTPEKFEKLTKPVKFRFLRQAKKVCSAIIYNIKYFLCYILYKIKILERYTRTDAGTKHASIAPIFQRFIETEYFRCQVEPITYLQYDIDEDYFYLKRKKNKWFTEKKIVLIVRDKFEVRRILRCRLTNCSININGKFYHHDFPSKFAITACKPWDYANGEATIERKVTKYDTGKLSRLCAMCYLSEEASQEEFEYGYKSMCKDLYNKLSSMTLEDLEVD